MNASTGAETKEPTILIVDDTPVKVAVLAEHLVSHGFLVFIAQPDRKNLFSLIGRQP